MGYLLLYESMLDTVLYARDKWLVPGGKMLPDKAKMYIAAIEDESYKRSHIGFWDEVYGVNMKCIQAAAMKDVLVDVVDKEYINSNSCMVLDLDLVKMKPNEVEFSVNYELQFNRHDKVHALIAWFDVEFSDLQHPITLSTSPFLTHTHWK